MTLTWAWTEASQGKQKRGIIARIMLADGRRTRRSSSSFLGHTPVRRSGALAGARL